MFSSLFFRRYCHRQGTNPTQVVVSSSSSRVLKSLQKGSVHRLCALSVGLLFSASQSVPCFCFCGDYEDLLTAIQGGVFESCNVDGKRGLRCTSLREWLAGFWLFGTPVTTQELVHVEVVSVTFNVQTLHRGISVSIQALGSSDCHPRECLPASQRLTHLHATCTTSRTRRGTEAGQRRCGFSDHEFIPAAVTIEFARETT